MKDAVVDRTAAAHGTVVDAFVSTDLQRAHAAIIEALTVIDGQELQIRTLSSRILALEQTRAV